jgi:hypothetical protein
VYRSYDQTDVPYVIFSPKFENIINSSYIESKSSLKNVTLIGGEGEGASRKYTTVGNGSGLDRREIFTDARDVSSDVGNGVVLTESEYTAQLKQRGKETLTKNTDVTSFEKVETRSVKIEDVFNGDVFQC